MAAVMALEDMAFGDYGLGGPLLGAEVVGSDLANTLLGGPEQGGSYTGGMGAGPSRTEAERLAAILNVNPYVAPSADMNLDPITSLRSGGQTGYYFANELGLPARYGDAGTPGFVPVDQNASYRLVKGGTDGNVVYSGAGEAGLRNVFEQANKLTLDNPKNAYWGVEVLDPATGQYKRVAENKGPNGLGIVGDIAGVALPVAAAIATGGASLGVQIAAGAAAGGLGGFLAGKDPLTSALISGVTAGLGNVTGANEAIGGVLSDVGSSVSNAFASEAAKEAAKQAVAEQILVTGLSKTAQGAASGLLQSAVSGVTGNLSSPTTQPTPAQQPVQEPVQQPPAEAAVKPIVVSGVKAGSGLPFASAVPVPVEAILNGTLAQPTPKPQPTTEEQYADEPIVVSAYRPINPVGGFDPTSVSKDLIGLGGSVAATLPALTELAMDPTLTQPQPEDIVVSGNRPVPKTVVPDELAAILPLLPQLGIPQVPTPDPALTEKGGVLGTGLNVPQLISLGSVGADLLKNLLAGGGGAETGVPYVSPFGTGAGVGFGTGQDMRANPTILDYERYGFGPEAMFFQPGYGLLNSAAPAPSPAFLPQAQPIMATNPRYEPLI